MELTSCDNISATYQRFMAEKDKSLELFYTFKRKKKPTTLKKEYWLWSERYLAKKVFSDSAYNYQLLVDDERYFKNIEGITEGISVEYIKQSFVFGMVYGESGFIFFHPENHSVWEIYLDDLYVCPLADSFDEFLANARLERTRLSDH